MKMSASGPDRTSNAFGAQSLSAGLSKNIADSGGLANTRATPVGRPTTDMARVAGMVSRGRARPGQVQAAQMMSQAANQERGVAALEKYYSAQAAPQPTPLATAASTMGVSVPATREDNIAAARAAGTFDATRDAYNAKAAASGQYMDAQGAIGSAPLPAPPTPQGIGSAMGGSVVGPAKTKTKTKDLTGSWGELTNPLDNAANQMGVNSFAPKYQ